MLSDTCAGQRRLRHCHLPLIALMQDQVDAMRLLGVPHFNSTQSADESEPSNSSSSKGFSTFCISRPNG